MKTRKTPSWLIIGALILIILLLVWLSEAIATGDTDVNAPLTSLANSGFIV